jgi:peptidoglycan/xylan/chitin deacetylase (PgdA/CDA1 family)
MPGPVASTSTASGTAEWCLALSFDDGPSHLTEPVLDLLGEHGARATFFLVGREVAERPDVVRRMAAEGHELANHTFSHARIGELSRQELERELTSTSDVIERVTGKRPSLLRPPYGADGAVAVPVASSLGMTTVLWSTNPKDWNGKSSEEIAKAVLDAAEPGAVVVLHDGGGDRRQTLDALRTIIPQLRGRGYSLVTISELLDRVPKARRALVPRNRRRFRLLPRLVS